MGTNGVEVVLSGCLHAFKALADFNQSRVVREQGANPVVLDVAITAAVQAYNDAQAKETSRLVKAHSQKIKALKAAKTTQVTVEAICPQSGANGNKYTGKIIGGDETQGFTIKWDWDDTKSAGIKVDNILAWEHVTPRVNKARLLKTAEPAKPISAAVSGSTLVDNFCDGTFVRAKVHYNFLGTDVIFSISGRIAGQPKKNSSQYKLTGVCLTSGDILHFDAAKSSNQLGYFERAVLEAMNG